MQSLPSTPVLTPLPTDTAKPPRTSPLHRLICSSQESWGNCGRLCQLPQPASPGTVLQGDSHHQQAWVLHPQRNRRSPRAREDGLCHPCPNGNPHINISIGSHANWHPQLCTCYSPTAPTDHVEDTRGSEHTLYHTASGPLQGWTHWPVGWATSATGEK